MLTEGSDSGLTDDVALAEFMSVSVEVVKALANVEVGRILRDNGEIATV